MQPQQYLILSNQQYTDDQYAVEGQFDHNNSYTYNSASKNKIIHTHQNNPNQELQDLLQSDTVNYSQLSTQKKPLFPYDISFFSKDHTQDLTNQQGYNQLVSKIHFERSRNRQLIKELAKQKEKIIQKYLAQIMHEFKQLSDQNQRLRQVYKKQAGGGYKQQQKQLIRNNSAKQQEMKKSSELGSQNQPISSQTPRNSNKVTSRKSMATMSMMGGNNTNRVFFGVGGGNFYQTQKLDTLRHGTGVNKLISCESSTNIVHHKAKLPNNIFANTQQQVSNLPQPLAKIHKRRQSQLTQRKDYPIIISNNKENYNEQFLMMCDEGEMSFYNNERLSQPGKMMKKQKTTQVLIGMDCNDSQKNIPCESNKVATRRRMLNQSIQRASFKLSLNQQVQDNSNLVATNTKNIFIEFLETLLLQEHLSSQALTETIQKTTVQQEKDILIPTFHNIRYIEQLQKQITNKNIKLRQLQEVINVFKLQIEQIMGTDVKIVNQLMIDLLQVKGKYLEMQQKVDNITRLKMEIQGKEMVKQSILTKMKLQTQKMEKQSHESKSQITTKDQKDNKNPIPAFPIPQSIQTLFQLLNIPIPKHSKPIEYLNKIKQLPKNNDLFQAFDSKKRASCNTKIKQVIDQIKEGRKKFNQVIKIYELRIVKLQEKIQKYRAQMSCSIGQEKKQGNIEK